MYATVAYMTTSVTSNLWLYVYHMHRCGRRQITGRQISLPSLFLSSFTSFSHYISFYHPFLLHVILYPYFNFPVFFLRLLIYLIIPCSVYNGRSDDWCTWQMGQTLCIVQGAISTNGLTFVPGYICQTFVWSLWSRPHGSRTWSLGVSNDNRLFTHTSHSSACQVYTNRRNATSPDLINKRTLVTPLFCVTPTESR
jgi:hypothetical protein